MSTDTTSIFYKIGQATKQNVNSAISDLLAADNNFTGTMTIGTTAVKKDLTVNGGTTITGDLTVQGLTTTLSTTNLDVKDNFIRLSEGASAGAFTKDQGFYFERGQGIDAASLVWDESAASFVLGTVASGAGTPAYLEEAYSAGVESLEFRKDANNNINAIIWRPAQGSTPFTDSTGARLSTITFVVGTGSPSANDLYGTTNGLLAASYSNSDYQSIKGNFSEHGYYYAESAANANNGQFHSLVASPGSEDIESIDYADDQGASEILLDYTYHEAVAAAGDSTSDTVSATPGAVNVGSLKIGTNPLGGLADFNAGLIA